jgi:hypothetical protein
VLNLKPWIPKGKRISGLLTALLICLLFFFLSPVVRAGETEILILHTNNVTGYILPCPT